LGILVRPVREPAAIAGMLAGLITMLCVRFGTHIAFTWYVLIGSVATFVTGLVTAALLGDFAAHKAMLEAKAETVRAE